MTILIAGLALFFGLHFLPMASGLRASFVDRLGAMPYRGLYSILSIIGLVLIVYGYGEARIGDNPVLYTPPHWTRHLTMLLMVPVFILLIAAYVQGRIKARFRHPMLLAVKIWAFAHLLVRGDLASVLLFGSFLAWAVIDRISLKRRTDGEPSVAIHLSEKRRFGDVGIILAGLAIFVWFVLQGHALVIGVPLS